MMRSPACMSFYGALRAWEKLMGMAAAVLDQDGVQAGIRYQHALVLAEEMLEACSVAGDDEVAQCGDAVVAAYVVAQHNLADIYRRKNAQALAGGHYQEAFQRLDALCKDVAAPEGLRLFAARHMTRALGEWVAHQQQCGNYPASTGQRIERSN